MTARSTTVHGPISFTSTKVVKLTDAASELFRTLYDLERAQKQAAKGQLAAELATLDIFAAEPNHEDYTPGGDAA